MSRKSPHAVLALTGTALFMIVLDNLIVASALPSIQRSLNTQLDTAQWVLDAYILTFAVLILIGSALGERFGRRRVFVAGLVIFTAASAAGALAPSIETLVAARAIQGAGSAILMPLTLTLLSNAFPPERRAWALGIWSAIAGIGVAAGPLAGGVITSALDWHWIFWLNVPLGVIAAIATPRYLDESRGRREPVDATGLILVSAGLLGIVWATVRGNDTGWTATSTIAAYAAGVVLIAAFLKWETRHEHPMLPLRFFDDARFSVSNAAGFLLSFAMFAAFVMAIQFLSGVRHESPVMAGVYTLPWTIMPLIVSPFSGRLGEKTNPAIPTAIGLALVGAGTLELAITLSPTTAPLALAPGFFSIGVGVGLVLPNIASLAIGAVQGPDIGKASGTLSTARLVGSVFGVAVAVAIFQAAGTQSIETVTSGISHAFAAAGLVSVLGSLIALTIVPQVATAVSSIRRPLAERA